MTDADLMALFDSRAACPQCADQRPSVDGVRCPTCERLKRLRWRGSYTSEAPFLVALELALECEDQAADSGYCFAVGVRSLCQSRAQADFEGSYVLVEVIENDKLDPILKEES